MIRYVFKTAKTTTDLRSRFPSEICLTASKHDGPTPKKAFTERREIRKIEKESWEIPEILYKTGDYERPKTKQHVLNRLFFPHIKMFERERMLKFYKVLDLRTKTLLKKAKDHELQLLGTDQKFIYTRLKILGWDLQTAHFLLFRKGKVKFRDQTKWLDDYDDANLPERYTDGFYIEGMDASSTNLVYEGLENFDNLKHLKFVNFSNCKYIDDFCIDRMSGLFGSTVEYLNLSDCTRITERGLIALSRMRKLRYLNVTGLNHISDFAYVCILLEDSIPDLYIEGAPNISLIENPLPKELNWSQ